MATIYGHQNTVSDLAVNVRSLLVTQLGAFKNGRPACWIEPPQAPPAGTGLHVFISRHATQITPDQYQWRVNLVQYDRSEEGIAKFDAAIALMRRRYPIRREVILPFSENTLMQATFSLIFNIHAYS